MKESIGGHFQGQQGACDATPPQYDITFQSKLDELISALSTPDLKEEAADIIRSLIDEIILSPNVEEPMIITLVGDMAGLLSIATNAKKPLDKSGHLISQVTMVAGARNGQARTNEVIFMSV